MPVLNWIGKDAVVRHDAEVPFRLLHDESELACLPSPSGRGAGGEGSEPAQNSTDNLIVEGDNLLALKALLPHYGGQVKCIYIDPPYNTGNEGWVYNDNVNSPQMREWLGKVVGKEAEDLTRHDKWLCMMYPRLKLMKRFLREDGVIFVSIDDHEVAALRMLMDEIFGGGRFVGDIIWQHSVQAKGYSGILSLHHNHTLVYGQAFFKLYDLERREEHNVNYSNPDNDPRGRWRSGDVRNALVRPNLMYDITTPSGNVIKHPPKGWRFSRETYDREVSEGKIVFSRDEKRIIRKIYLADQEGRVPESIWFATEAGTTREANAEVADVLGSKDGFDTPKPTRLLQRILQIASDKDSLILDSFAGSGTTAHAVLKQNAEDGGNRRCILVEMDSNIARNVTAERVKRVARGYTNAKGESVAGLGGGFRYATLGKPLFDAEGHYINPKVKFAELARFVWFMETGGPWTAAATETSRRHPREGGDPATLTDASATKALDSRLRGNDEQKQGWNDEQKQDGRDAGLSPLLGVHEGRAVYLLYNGILKDKSTGGGNVLTSPLLAELPEHDGPRTIYGTRCLIKPERLRALRIVFKQLPHELKVAR